MAVFYDTHAHLDYGDFDKEIDQVIARANEAGITRIISIGTDSNSSQRCIALAERFEQVFAVVGWHPSEALRAPEDVRDELRQLADHPKVVALGETGLDYYRMPSHKGGTAEDDEHYRQRQAELFKQHLEVAAELQLNCVIHQRSSLRDTIDQLGPFADRVRGQFHCFTEEESVMREILALGSIVSFTGVATFKNAQSVRDTLAVVPNDQFMLETDSPYLAPVPYRGKRCEPAYVKEIAKVAAETRGCSLEELSQTTCATAHQFFPKLS